MKRQRLKWIILSMVVLGLLPLACTWSGKKPIITGKEILNFTLPSSQDRVINYAEEYYGKHHLIMTFFPAAYTPV